MPAFAAVMVCAALTSCGGPQTTARPPSSPTPATTASPSPTGDRLVLRWRRTGGIAGVGGPGSVPEFSLYSSGRAVVASGRQPGELTEYRLRPEAVRPLVDGARAAGLGRPHTVGSDQIADAFIIVVTLDGATTRIIQPESLRAPEAQFLKRLDPTAWPKSSQATEPKPYRPAKTAVLAGKMPATGTVRRWPLAPLGDGEPAAGATCTLAAADKVPITRPDVAWRSKGKTYSVRLRPLLPAESSCHDIT